MNRQALIALAGLAALAAGGFAWWWSTRSRGSASPASSSGTPSLPDDFAGFTPQDLALPDFGGGFIEQILQPVIDMTTPRGIRNNNPFNLRPGSNWQGLDTPSADAGGYLRFLTPLAGIRAGIINLINQQKKHGLSTIRAIIAKYAPPAENNTDAYIATVSRALGISPDMPLSLGDDGIVLNFARAIITHENGQQPYSDFLLSQALAAARAAT